MGMLNKWINIPNIRRKTHYQRWQTKTDIQTKTENVFQSTIISNYPTCQTKTHPDQQSK